MKAIVAGMLPQGKRSLAFGLFYAGYGSGWLVGSIATGLLYEHSRIGLIAFAMAMQLASLPIFVIAHRREMRQQDHHKRRSLPVIGNISAAAADSAAPLNRRMP